MTTPIDLFPPAPLRSAPVNYPLAAEDFMVAIEAAVPQMNAQNEENNTINATVLLQAALAAQSAQDAAAAVNVAAWSPVTAYATNALALSPSNLQAYRRKSPGGSGGTDPATSADWVPAYGYKGLGVLRNMLVNSLMTGNSRALTGSIVLAANARGHDCWKAGTGGCTYSVTAGVVTITAGTLRQVIDGACGEAGVYTLSYTGTAQARINTNGYASGVQSYNRPLGEATSIEFGVGTFSLAQFERGYTPTEFERLSPAVERSRTDWYVRRLLLISSAGDVWVGASGGNIVFYPSFQTFAMRTMASVSYLNNTGLQYLNGSAVWTNSTISSTMRGEALAQVLQTNMAVDTAANRYVRQSANLDVYAILSAEL
jgi:hypothetical protein